MKKTLLIIGGLFFCVISWYSFVVNREEFYSVVILDVGQGSGAYIKTVQGYEIIADVGETNKTLRNISKFRMPWDKHINMVIASHPDKDHIGMFPEIIRRFDIDTYVDGGKQSLYGVYPAIMDQLRKKNISATRFQVGDMVHIEPGITITFLHPYIQDVEEFSNNEASVVFILDIRGMTFLFMGDAGIPTEKELIKKYGDTLDIDVLVVGHHGSKSSTSDNFLEATTPQYAVISVGAANRYGHPHAGVIKRLNDRDIPILRTDLLGNIQFRIFDNRFDIVIK